MYRTAAPGRREPDTLVVCRACAAPAEVMLDDGRDGSYACPRCTTEQPTLATADELGAAKISYVSHVKGSDGELEALLESFDPSNRFSKAVQVELDCGGIRVLVSLGLNSGTVTGCELVAFRKELVPMRLLREGSTHREGKVSGVLAEVQTGDDEFDGAVFIETAAAAADVRTALSSPGVRAAVRRLLEDVPAVDVTDSHVKIDVPLMPSTFVVEAIRERIAALRVVAGAPRPLVRTYVELSRAVLVTRALVWLSLPVSIFAVVISGQNFTVVRGNSFVTGLVAGLVAAALLAVVIGRVLRGRSTSGREILRARLMTFVTVPILAFGSLVFVNGAFDESSERIVEMNVESPRSDDDDPSKFNVTTHAPDGSEHTYSFTGSVPKDPSRVRVSWRSGALGWTWQSGRAVLLNGAVAP